MNRFALGEPQVLPSFAKIAAAVNRYFATVSDYQPGDLISRSHIDQTLAEVRAAGWEVPNAAMLAERGMPNGSFLVRELSKPAGKRFMRRVSTVPGAYPRLDRLSTISRGEANIRHLIASKGGDEFVRYLTTTKGGRHMGRQLAGAKHGVDLNKPTGRIYTAEELLIELKRLYDAAAP